MNVGSPTVLLRDRAINKATLHPWVGAFNARKRLPTLRASAGVRVASRSQLVFLQQRHRFRPHV